MVSNYRKKESRLAPPTGAYTGSRESAAVVNPPRSRLEQAGHALSFATSGKTFIQDTTGYDISNLPGILEKPLDFLANPVGLASLLAAVPSGGVSLAALGARGVGARLAGAAIKDVAGGLVGTAAGEAASKYAPGPDWLRAGIGLGVGAVVGAKTGSAVGKKLPASFSAAVGPNVPIPDPLNKRYDIRPNPLPLEDAHPELTKIQQLSNFVKESLGQGVKAHPQVTPILDQSERTLRIAAEDVKRFQLNVARLKSIPEIGLKDTDSATTISVFNKTTNAMEDVPVADAAAHPSLYEMTPLQRGSLKTLSDELDAYHKQYRSVNGRIGVRKDIERGGFYLPRGTLNEFPGMPYATKRGLLKNPDAARAADYTTQAEGIAAGVKYPKLEDAVSDYVTGLSEAAVGAHAANQFAKIKDVDGNFVIRTAEDMLPQQLKSSYLSAEAKSYGLERKMEQAIADKQKYVDQQSAISYTMNQYTHVGTPELRNTAATLTKKINDLDVYIKDLETEISNHAPIFDSVKDVYARELAAIKSDPTLGTIDPLNMPNSLKGHGSTDQPIRQDKFYGPKEVTDAINSQLNPNGLYTAGRQVANSVNAHLRLWHTLADISDFGRLAGTAGLTHPFDFFKGIQTGFKSIMSPASLAEDFKSVNMELKANGIPFAVKDMVKYGELPMSNLDIDIGLFAKLPKSNWLQAVSNVTQNGITSARIQMIKTELLNMKAAGRNIDEAALTEAVRNIKLVSGASIHRGLKGADMFIQFPNWIQSQFEYMGHAAVGMPSALTLGAIGSGVSAESKFAAKSMIRLIGVGLATTYTVNAMSGKPTEYKNGVPMMRIGDTTVDVFGPYGSLARGMYAAMAGDIEPLVRSRVSPLFSIGWDLGSGKTFIGDTASFDDPEYWAQAFGPYSVTQGLRNQGGTEVTILQGAGVRASHVSSYKLLREQAQETMGMDYAELSGNQKELLRRSNPALVDDLEKKTQENAAKGDKYAQAAIANEDVNNNLLDQQQTLNNLVQNSGLSPRQMRESLRSLQQAAAERKQQIRKDYGLDASTKLPSESQSALNDYFDLFTKADSGILEGGAKTGIVDWDTFQLLEDDLMRSLTPQQQKAVTDKFVRRDPSLDWFYANQEVIKSSGYFDAVDASFDRVRPMAKAFDPSIDSYTELRAAFYKAQKEGNTGKVLRLNSIINQSSKYLQLARGVMLRNNPSLYKALVEDGYLEQAMGRPLAANIN